MGQFFFDCPKSEIWIVFIRGSKSPIKCNVENTCKVTDEYKIHKQNIYSKCFSLKWQLCTKICVFNYIYMGIRDVS